MSYRTWLFIAALGLLIWQPAYSQQLPEPQEETQLEGARDDQEGQPDTDQDANPELGGPPDFLPAIQGIEAAIRDLIAEQGRQASRDPGEYEVRDLKAQEDMAWWARWMFYAALASVAVTAVGVELVRRTLKATLSAAEHAENAAKSGWEMVRQAKAATAAADRAADVTREIGVVQNRPWLTISEPTLTSIKVFPGIFSGADRSIWIEFSVMIENVGRTAAKGFFLAGYPVNAEEYGAAIEDVRKVVMSSGGVTDAIAPTEKRLVRLNGTIEFNLPTAGTSAIVDMACVIACGYSWEGSSERKETYRLFLLSKKQDGGAETATLVHISSQDIEEGTAVIGFRHFGGGMT